MCFASLPAANCTHADALLGELAAAGEGVAQCTTSQLHVSTVVHSQCGPRNWMLLSVGGQGLCQHYVSLYLAARCTAASVQYITSNAGVQPTGSITMIACVDQGVHEQCAVASAAAGAGRLVLLMAGAADVPALEETLWSAAE